MKKLMLILWFCVQTAYSINLDSGLVLYLPFNGNANDASGKSHHGTINGASLTTDMFGQSNTAYNFDGVNDYIQVNHHSDLQPDSTITVCAWINISRFRTIAAANDIIYKGFNDDTQGRYNLRIRADFKRFTYELTLQANGQIGYLTAQNMTATILDSNEWIFLVGIYDTERITRFVNAIYDTALVFQYNQLFTNTYPLIIGGSGDVTANYWYNGKIDEVRIYNRSITNAEVLELYKQGLSLTTNNVDGNTFCAGDSIDVSFTSNLELYTSNTFTIELSEPNGSFGNPTILGFVIASNSSSKKVLLPINLPTGTNYRIRVISSSPDLIGSDNRSNLTIYAFPTPRITGNNTFCAGSSTKYYSNKSTGLTYRWIVSGGNIVGSNTNDSLTVNWVNSGNGIVKLIQTNENGCSDSTEISVTVHPLPVPTITGQSQVCKTGTYNYSSCFTNGNSYLWSVTGGTIQGSSTDTLCSITFANADSAIVNLVQTVNATGCKDSTTKTVYLNNLPNPVITGNEIVCQGNLERYGTTIVNGTEHQWNIANGEIISSPNQNTVDVIWNNSGSGTITLEQTITATGCNQSNNQVITINPRPNAVISGDTSICVGQRIEYSTSPTAGHSYQWVAENAILEDTISETNVYCTWNTAGTYEVMLIETITSTGCMDTAKIIVIVNNLPVATINGMDKVCQDCLETYYTQTETDVESTWLITRGTVIGSPNKDTIQVRWGLEGNGNIELQKHNTTTDCYNNNSLPIIITRFPTPNITGDTIVCVYEDKTYTTTSDPTIIKQWYVKNGKFQSDSSKSVVKVLWDTFGEGQIKVVLRKDEDGFLDSVENKVIIHKRPSVTWENFIGDYCLNDSPVLLQGALPLGGQYSGNGVSNGMFYPLIAGSGVTNITYTYQDIDGCSNHTWVTFHVFPNPTKPEISENNKRLASTTATTYKWYFEDIAIESAVQQFYQPTETGYYKVEITDNYNCTAMSDPYYFDVTDVEDTAQINNSLRTIPNPFTDRTTIQWTMTNSAIVSLSVTNVLGSEIMNLVESKEYSEGVQTFDFDSKDLPAGVYFIAIKIENNLYLEKMVIIK